MRAKLKKLVKHARRPETQESFDRDGASGRLCTPTPLRRCTPTPIGRGFSTPLSSYRLSHSLPQPPPPPPSPPAPSLPNAQKKSACAQPLNPVSLALAHSRAFMARAESQAASRHCRRSEFDSVSLSLARRPAPHSAVPGVFRA
jgi:hypothetical protein